MCARAPLGAGLARAWTAFGGGTGPSQPAARTTCSQPSSPLSLSPLSPSPCSLLLLPLPLHPSNALRNNLLHPNEYIRGCTLRLLCKLKEPELLEPLVPAVKQCLTHRHPYVRRNAVLTVFSIARQFPDRYPDAVEDVERFMEEESDPSSRRNAFVMLFGVAQERAIGYLSRNLEKVLNFGDGFALILLELIRKLARAGSVADGSALATKAKFIRIVFSLLDNPSPAVSFEAAATLVSLSATPHAVRAAAGAYIKILIKESDNNVKLIVLEKLAALRKRHARVLREQIMDILRALATPNTDIRRKTLEVAMDLVSPRNVEEVMALLKKEIVAGSSKGGSGSASGSASGSGSSAAGAIEPDAATYRGYLISAIHGCAVRFPEVASNVVHLLMDFLAGDGALSVIEFVREIVETFPDMRAMVLAKLRSVCSDITASEVHRVALWVLGQYSQSAEEVAAAQHCIRECIGPLPLTMPFAEYAAYANARPEEGAGGEEAATASASASKHRGPVVLADGTYASQTALTDEGRARAGAPDLEDTPVPSLRKLLLAGDFYLGSVVASTLSKLALRVVELAGRDSRPGKTTLVDAMLVMCSLVELGGSGLAGTAALLPAHLMLAVSGRSYGAAGRPGAGGGGGGGGGTGTGGEKLTKDSEWGGSGAPGGALAGGGGSTGGAAAPSASSASASSAAAVPSGIRIDQDSFERIVLCMRVLGDPASCAAALPVLLHSCRGTFRALLMDRRHRAAQAVAEGVAGTGQQGVSFALGALAGAPGAGGAGASASASSSSSSSSSGLRGSELASRDGNEGSGRVRADAPLLVRQLRGAGKGNLDDLALGALEDVEKAAGSGVEDFAARLQRVLQLTGFADPVYCEAYVRIHEFDIVLELLVINRTDTTLTNVALEMSVMGDLKLVDRPPIFTLGPRDSRTLKANIKVSSTETGHIFGTIAYNTPASPNDQIVVNLVEIHVDIMDYIHPAMCS